MNIPDEMLPRTVEINSASGLVPSLPPMPVYPRMNRVGADEKARRYLEEACRALALARYWANRAE